MFLIYSEDHIKIGRFRRQQKSPVLQPSKASVSRRLAVVVVEEMPQSLINAFVEEAFASSPAMIDWLPPLSVINDDWELVFSCRAKDCGGFLCLVLLNQIEGDGALLRVGN